MLQKNYISSSVAIVIDANDIDREVTRFDPKTVVLEALWVTPEKLRELMNLDRHKNRNWVIRIHSKPTFLAMEGCAMKWLGEFVNMTDEFPNLILAANNHTTVNELSRVFSFQFEYLPNYYHNHNVQADLKVRGSSVVSIGCFGAQRPLKNTLTQALAAIIYANNVGKRLEFYVNTDRVEQHGETVLKNVRETFKFQADHRLVEVTWKSHDEFLKLVAMMDLGMQVSLTESFNIVTADFVSVGVPIVVSDEITWMPWLNKAPTTDAIKIADKLQSLYDLPRFVVRSMARRNLRKYNEVSQTRWITFVT